MAVDARVPRRAGRFRLYLPFLILAVLAGAWSVAWFVIRGQIVGGLDGWIAAEAAAGRTWTCPDRSIGGFPFRIEIRCSNLTLQRTDVTASMGPLLIVEQAYDPRHLIAELGGPLTVKADGVEVSSTWRLLQASVATASGRIMRVAIAADDPVTHVALPDGTKINVTSKHVEVHGRPDPNGSGSLDLAVTTAGSVIPGLDGLIGATEPADIELLATVTQARNLPARALWSELERWRANGGEVRFTRVDLRSGPRRLAATGRVAIDELHRPLGEVTASARDLGGVVGQYTGSGIGRLLGAIAGGGGRQASRPGTNPADPPLDPLPPLRAEGGRVFVGPIQIPGLRLPRLY